MKTVSTKLDNRDFEKFQEICNQEGQCMSEELRDLVKRDIEAIFIQIKNTSQKCEILLTLIHHQRR